MVVIRSLYTREGRRNITTVRERNHSDISTMAAPTRYGLGDTLPIENNKSGLRRPIGPA